MGALSHLTTDDLAIFESTEEMIAFLVELREESENSADSGVAASCTRLLSELLGTRRGSSRRTECVQEVGRDGLSLSGIQDIRDRLLEETWTKLEAVRDDWKARFPAFGYHAIGMMSILGSALEAELIRATSRLRMEYASKPRPWRRAASDDGRWRAGDFAQLLMLHLRGRDRWIAKRALLVQIRRNRGIHNTRASTADVEEWLCDALANADLTRTSAARTLWHVIADASSLE